MSFFWQMVAYGAQDVYLRADGTYGSPNDIPRRTALGTINVYDATVNPIISFSEQNKKRCKKSEVILNKIYDIDNTECNVCYDISKVAKCQHCMFHVCETCYDKIDGNKCTHCKSDFFGIQ